MSPSLPSAWCTGVVGVDYCWRCVGVNAGSQRAEKIAFRGKIQLRQGRILPGKLDRPVRFVDADHLAALGGE